ncbi:MAG: vitamin B12-dependent ribonucleotide reductase [Acidobacteria bacterium]|nr:vitamin B12-dependent ribonucleotide reductase [Acidobacteriota bacterium]
MSASPENTLGLIDIQGEAAPAKVEDSGEESASPSGKLKFKRFFTTEDVHPYDELKWEKRTATITNDRGKVIFNQDNVEVPESWSQTAVNIVVSKYFWGPLGTDKRETSMKQLVDRVADTLSEWGLKDKYFDEESAAIFNAELKHILINQKASFNSPVWFNMGIEKKPQCSACFINSVKDTMDSILNLAKTEGMLFKYGSGTGSNLSSLRSSREKLTGGGTASGPVSFMRGYDSFAGVIKSGGKTRRAAKMVILNIDHPDIVEFIKSKQIEEEKAKALINAGYDGSVGGEAYNSVFYQNGNHSVRIPDPFMKACEEDREWYTKAVLTGKTIDVFKARDLLKMVAEAAHQCGDPGVQFDTTINKWHTCAKTDRIHASNPCSEYMFLDDSACNLASLNLLKYTDADGNFDVEAFRHSIDILITSQELIVENAGYPREEIEINSHKFRPLGLGYANLGAMLMANGLPYDSDEGRALAAAVTAIMTGQAYLTSSIIAEKIGTFSEYELNKESMLRVIKMHKDAVEDIDSQYVPRNVFDAARETWKEALEYGKKYGYRNAQATVLAPTGTIGFMMDCDTTGIEPDLALVKYKSLAGGGNMKLVNKTVPKALDKLEYTEEQVLEIVDYISANSMIEGAPHLKDEHLAVFDCAFKPRGGKRFIHYMGHIMMMAAVQPFISGAISKTVNIPEDTTAEEISEIYVKAWEIGLKAIAIYRDNSKGQQVLTTDEKGDKIIAGAEKGRPIRMKLPEEREAITHKFSLAGHEGYITVGMYENGMPGEIFLVMAKEGSTISGLMDSFATAVSLALQYGVPLEVLVNKFSYTRFEPSGFTGNREISYATSIMDYIFRWLGTKFLDKVPNGTNAKSITSTESSVQEIHVKPEVEQVDDSSFAFENQEDAPPCHACGAIMVRNGSCYKCLNCGETSGCS